MVRSIEKSTGFVEPNEADIAEVKTEGFNRFTGLTFRDIWIYRWRGDEWAGHPEYGRFFVRATFVSA